MARSDRYDHVLSEEYDDYEDRRRCGSCRAREPAEDSMETYCERSPSSSCTAIVLNCVLFLLMVSAMLAIGIVVVMMCGSYYFRAKGDGNSIFSKIAVPTIGCPVRPRNCKVTDWLVQDRKNNRKCCRKQKCCKKQKNPVHPLELVVRRLLRFLQFTQ